MGSGQRDTQALGDDVRVGYTRNEIVWLRSLSHEEAQALDEHVVSSVYDPTVSASADDPPLPVIVRWHEVRVAASRALVEKRDREIFAMRCEGISEKFVADHVGLDRSSVNRRFKAAIERVQDALGGEPAIRKPALSTPPACIRCAARPRARAQAVRPDSKGFWRIVEPERELAVCALCLAVELRPKLLLRVKDLSHVHKPARSAS